MRLGLALLLLVLPAACRRAEPSAPPAPPPLAPAPAAEAPPPAPPQAAEAPAPPDPAPAEAPAAAAAPAPSPPPPASPPPKAPDRRAEEEDGTIYRWVDAQGVLHFSTAEDIPPSRRASAKPVLDTLLVNSPEAALPAQPPAAAPASPADDAKPKKEDQDEEPGDQPKLDAQGLPIPGTMKQTAHTRAVQQATGGQQLDPASVERQRQEELRDMKCREVDGVTICG